MFRYVPFVVTTILALGAAGAEAHPSNLRPAAMHAGARTGQVLAFTGTSAVAQGDDVAAKVKAALKADSALGSVADAVTVTAAGGVVTLEGTVPSVQVRAKIGEFVMKMDGVTKMVNKLKLPKK